MARRTLLSKRMIVIILFEIRKIANTRFSAPHLVYEHENFAHTSATCVRSEISLSILFNLQQ